MDQYPKVLVISNECFSNITSNGRTIKNFFIGWPTKRIAQFYIQNSYPCMDICKNYYRVTDMQALKSFFLLHDRGGPLKPLPNNLPTIYSHSKRQPRRNALTMMLREVIWDFGTWKTDVFANWVESFSPEIIFVQVGDNSFMLKIANRLAKSRQIPLVVFNTESYFFKNYDYFRSKGIARLLYPWFHKNYCRTFVRVINDSSYLIYNCKEIQTEYCKNFSISSTVIHTSSEISRAPKNDNHEHFITSYLGNMGGERYKNLIIIANTLQEISKELFLDVYGYFPNDMAKREMMNCEGIRYHGFISYDNVIQVIHESDLLVHTESFSPFYIEDLRYAFSTKIADCLASGTTFLLFAPDSIASSIYLKENEAAFVVTDVNELAKVIGEIINNKEKDRYIQNALGLVERNHNVSRNAESFQNIFIGLANNNYDGSDL